MSLLDEGRLGYAPARLYRLNESGRRVGCVRHFHEIDHCTESAPGAGLTMMFNDRVFGGYECLTSYDGNDEATARVWPVSVPSISIGGGEVTISPTPRWTRLGRRPHNDTYVRKQE